MGFCYNPVFCHSAFHILRCEQLAISWGCANAKQIGGKWSVAVTWNEIAPGSQGSVTEFSIGLVKGSVNAMEIVTTPSITDRRGYRMS